MSVSSSVVIPLPRNEYGKFWRWLTVVAGLVLAASFFMPWSSQKLRLDVACSTFMTQWTSDDPAPSISTPYGYWAQFIERLTTTRVSWWLAYCSQFSTGLFRGMLPQALGLVLATCSLAQLCQLPRMGQLARRVGLGLTIAVGVFYICSNPLGYLIVYGGFADFLPRSLIIQALPYLLAGTAMTVFFAVIPLFHLLRASRYRPWTSFYRSFMTAFLLVVVAFLGSLYQVIYYRAPYGAAIILIASCIMFVARAGEARAASRLSWFWTIIGLLALRLHRWALPLGHCDKCGYNLMGNISGICPECGTPRHAESTSDLPELECVKAGRWAQMGESLVTTGVLVKDEAARTRCFVGVLASFFLLCAVIVFATKSVPDSVPVAMPDSKRASGSPSDLPFVFEIGIEVDSNSKLISGTPGLRTSLSFRPRKFSDPEPRWVMTSGSDGAPEDDCALCVCYREEWESSSYFARACVRRLKESENRFGISISSRIKSQLALPNPVVSQLFDAKTLELINPPYVFPPGDYELVATIRVHAAATQAEEERSSGVRHGLSEESQ